MYRNQSPFEVPQLTHKDNVISTLKKELVELQDLETDFSKINDEISRLETKYSLLVSEKERTQKDHKQRVDLGKKALIELRADIDKVKLQIHKVNSQIEDTSRENTTLKRIVDNRNSEIEGLVHRNTDFEKRNQQQAEENRNVTFNIKQLKKEKQRLEGECEKIHALLDNSVIALKNADKNVRVLEETVVKLEKNIMEAGKDNQDLLIQLKGKETSFAKNEKTFEALQAKRKYMIQKNKQLENDSENLQDDVNKVNANLTIEITKNKQLVTKLKNIQNTVRATENQLQEVRNKKDGLKADHYELIDDNKRLNGDLDNSLLTILQFEKLNEELQREIENYIETDQQARKLLDRKNVMKTLLQQVNGKLEKTNQQIAHLR